jgi:vitamin B12 transporter
VAVGASSPVRCLIGALVWALLAAHARADEAPPSVTVRGARPDPDGASVTRIPTIAFTGELRHVGELVTAAPGTTVIDYGGVLATTSVSVRGASADEVQIILGGVPLNATSGGGFDLSLIPAALIDSVEVRRGAEGAEVGAGAMGGAVILEPASRSRVVLTGGTLGTWGASGSWASSKATSDWHWLVAADARRSTDDFTYHRDPTPEIANNDALLNLRRENNDATLGSVLIRASRELSSGVALSQLLWLSGSDRGLAGDIYSPTPHSRQLEGTGFLDSRVTVPLGHDAHLELPITVRGGLVRSFDTGDSSSATQRTVDVAARPRWAWRLGDWTLGASGLGGYETFDGAEFGQRNRTRVALGLDAAVEKASGSLTAVLRYERWASASAILPRLGGTVRLSRIWTIAGNVGAGFRPPSFGELYYSSGPLIPNPDLLPERSISGDLALRFRRAGFSGSLTGFLASYQDVILYEIYPGFRAKPFNIGQARSYGAELELRWRPQIEALHGLTITGAFTEMIAENLVPGQNTYGMRLPYRPEQRGVARVDYEHERWRAAVEVQATGRAFINRSNTRSLDPYTDLRMSAGVRLGGLFWLSAEMRNGLNVMDRMTIDGYPLPGRVFLAHLSWEPIEGEVK